MRLNDKLNVIVAAALLALSLIFVASAHAQTTYDDTDPSIIYSTTPVAGTGWTGATNDGLPDYDATQHYSNGCVTPVQSGLTVQGAEAAINFIGTSITLIGEKGTNFGIGAYAIDGGAITTADSYSATHLYQQTLFTASGLANAPHVLTYQVTCNKNAASSAYYQVLDAYTVTGTNNPLAKAAQNSYGAGNIKLSGSGWTCATNNAQDISGSQCWDGTAGDSLSYTFTGSLAEVFIRPDVGDGYFDVQIDGTTVAHDVNGQYTQTDNDQLTGYMGWAMSGLSAGQHTMKLIVDGSATYPSEAENSGQKNLLQFDVGLSFPAVAGATPTPTSTATPSPNCTEITTSGPTINVNGNLWSFSPTFQALENGAVFGGSGANLADMTLSSGAIFVFYPPTSTWYVSSPAGTGWNNGQSTGPSCGATPAPSPTPTPVATPIPLAAGSYQLLTGDYAFYDNETPPSATPVPTASPLPLAGGAYQLQPGAGYAFLQAEGTPTPTPTPAPVASEPTPVPLNSPVSPVTYGADPTGVHDSSAAFQSAANAGDVDVPTGTYSFNSTANPVVMLPAGRNVRCEPGAVLVQVNKQAQILFQADGGSVFNCAWRGPNYNTTIPGYGSFQENFIDIINPSGPERVIGNDFNGSYGYTGAVDLWDTTTTGDIIGWNTFEHCGYYSVQNTTATGATFEYNTMNDCAGWVEANVGLVNTGNVGMFNHYTWTYGDGWTNQGSGGNENNVTCGSDANGDPFNYSGNSCHDEVVDGPAVSHLQETPDCDTGSCPESYAAVYSNESCTGGCVQR